jgi:hypothetical protein
LMYMIISSGHNSICRYKQEPYFKGITQKKNQVEKKTPLKPWRIRNAMETPDARPWQETFVKAVLNHL